jgi:hypothetical protein
MRSARSVSRLIRVAWCACHLVLLQSRCLLVQATQEQSAIAQDAGACNEAILDSTTAQAARVTEACTDASEAGQTVNAELQECTDSTMEDNDSTMTSTSTSTSTPTSTPTTTTKPQSSDTTGSNHSQTSAHSTNIPHATRPSPLNPHAWVVTASVLAPPRIPGNTLRPDFGTQSNYVHWTCHLPSQTQASPAPDTISCCKSIVNLMWQMPELLCWHKHQCASLVKKSERDKAYKTPSSIRERNDFVRHCVQQIQEVPSLTLLYNDTLHSDNKMHGISHGNTTKDDTHGTGSATEIPRVQNSQGTSRRLVEPRLTLIEAPQKLPPLEAGHKRAHLAGARIVHQVTWASSQQPRIVPAVSPIFPSQDLYTLYNWTGDESDKAAQDTDEVDSHTSGVVSHLNLTTVLHKYSHRKHTQIFDQANLPTKPQGWFRHSLTWTIEGTAASKLLTQSPQDDTESSYPDQQVLQSSKSITRSDEAMQVHARAVLLYFAPQDVWLQPRSRKAKLTAKDASPSSVTSWPCRSSCGGMCKAKWRFSSSATDTKSARGDTEGTRVETLVIDWEGPWQGQYDRDVYDGLANQEHADSKPASNPASSRVRMTCTISWDIPIWMQDQDEDEGVLPGPALLDARVMTSKRAWHWNHSASTFPPIFAMATISSDADDGGDDEL